MRRRSEQRKGLRALWTLVMVFSLGLAGGVGLVAVFGRSHLVAALTGAAPGASTPPASVEAGGSANREEDVWYTCGMHPQVMQRGPGVCPICGMKLTPKKGASANEAAAGPKAAEGPQERKILYWRSPMHPDFVSDHPGKDFMGHDLVPVYSEEEESVSGSIIRIDPVAVQNMGIRTARLRRGPLVKTVRTVGRIDYDEQRLVFVDTKIEGWIEKLHVDQTGQHVRKGDPLFEVYSPDLYSAQVEFISALRRLPTLPHAALPEAAEDAQRMVEAGRLKLEFLDVPADQVARLEETRTPVKTIEIQSPADGIIADKAATLGMRIMPGVRLYTIADLSRVWVYVDIYEYQLPWVYVGQAAMMTLPYIPDKVFRGEVTYIYPYLQKQTRVIKVRLEFENPTLELKPEMFANVMLEGLQKEDVLLMPREGYIDSGMRKVAFVDRGHGKFEPRTIEVGMEGEGGMVEVLLGLEAGEVVVTSGQFLLDSESKLEAALTKMREPARPPPLAEEERATAAPTPASTAPPPDAAYACPMALHPEEANPADQGAYFAPEPGDCPRCGMALAPIESLDWARAAIAAGGAKVGYTCVRHPNIYSTAPGACPLCDAPLEPFKALYTCRDSKHVGQVGPGSGPCPLCGEPMAVFRGPWLSESLAALNPQPTESTLTAVEAAAQSGHEVPQDASYVCPMQECWQFSALEGRCPICGMKLLPIKEVEWASRLAEALHARPFYTCPMHADQAKSDEPGLCPICAMRLVPRDHIVGLNPAGSKARQVDFLTEHYLGLAEQLAGDSLAQVASHALGLVDASEELKNLLEEARKQTPDEGQEEAGLSAQLLENAVALHKAALKLRGVSLDDDRVQFAQISRAMRKIVESERPDKSRWPTLFIYHCPLSQADWIQAVEKKANPYYGFKMLDCGKLMETK